MLIIVCVGINTGVGVHMSVPDFQEFMLPLLRLASEKDISAKSAVDPLAQEFSLTPADTAERIPTGQSRMVNRIAWALVYLTKAGLLERPARGIYRITTEGQTALAQQPEKIDVKFLSHYESYRAFNSKNKTEKKPTSIKITKEVDKGFQSPTENTITPDERLTEAYEEIEAVLLSEIKEQLLKLSPTAFERLIIELMKGLNYGARGLVQHVGGSRDGGLDGLGYGRHLRVGFHLFASETLY
ncbi:MAG: hypothetical protein LBV79_11280 [Candidatus Adiutrix sp.]|jgi:restriction system protein|nr:hypothetical protein [Candidatus Adiutrix sp.]